MIKGGVTLIHNMIVYMRSGGTAPITLKDRHYIASLIPSYLTHG